jgi:hypothetical protein
VSAEGLLSYWRTRSHGDPTEKKTHTKINKLLNINLSLFYGNTPNIFFFEIFDSKRNIHFETNGPLNVTVASESICTMRG